MAITEKLLTEQIAGLMVGKAKADALGSHLTQEVARLRNLLSMQGAEIERLKALVPQPDTFDAVGTTITGGVISATTIMPPEAPKAKRPRKNKATVQQIAQAAGVDIKPEGGAHASA